MVNIAAKNKRDGARVDALAAEFEAHAHLSYDPTDRLHSHLNKSDFYLFKDIRKATYFRLIGLNEGRLVQLTKLSLKEGSVRPVDFSDAEKRLLLEFSKLEKMLPATADSTSTVPVGADF